MNGLAFREFVAFVLMAMFTFVLVRNPSDPIIIGALVTGFAGAWGFYLGGSKVGSDTATKNADTVAANATAALVTSDLPQPINVAEVGGEPVKGAGS